MASATERNRGKRTMGKSRRRKANRGPVQQAVASVMERTKDAAIGFRDTVASYVGGNIEVEFDSLRDLYIKELQDLYGAEQQLLKALPKMAESSHSAALRNAFEAHRKETAGQVLRLEQIFGLLGLPPRASECQAMAGLVGEGAEWMKQQATAGVMDAGLIAVAQRVEHYEMAGYGCVRTYARLLGDKQAADLLQETLDEEGAADKKLTQLARRINVQATGGRPRNTARRRTARSVPRRKAK